MTENPHPILFLGVVHVLQWPSQFTNGPLLGYFGLDRLGHHARLANFVGGVDTMMELTLHWSVLAGAVASFVGVSLAVLVSLVKIVSIGQDLRTTVTQIKTNDLPHLHTEVKELRKEFIQHLMEVRNGTTIRASQKA